jgi:far upstream element-binding protein
LKIFFLFVQVAAKLQIAGGNNNKRSLDDLDDEPHSKRFSGGSDWSANSSMSPAHLQQAQQAAAQVAARLGGGGYHQNSTIPNPEAVQKAKELISKMIPQTQMGGGGGAPPAGPGPNRAGLGSNNYEEIMIPGSKVGLIIGKGGETIKQLQERTGAKMVVVQDGPGQEMEKPLRISGDPQKVEHAKQLVYELIQDKGEGQQSNNRGGSSGGNSYAGNNRHQDREGGGHHGGGGGGGGYGGPPHGGDSKEIFVPKLAVGVVIGKGGDMIKKIQAETGCRLQFLQTKNDGPGDRRCVIQGTKQQVDDGNRMIEDLIESVMRRNSGNNHQNNDWNSGGGGGGNSYQQHQPSGGQAGGVQVVQEQYQFVVPASKCGIIIGRSGDTIKQINSQSGAHCEMDRKISANQTVEKTFTVKGEQHQVDEAKRLIQDKINMDITLVHLGSQTVTQPANGFGGQGGGASNPYQQSWGGYNAGSNQGWDGNQPQMGGASGGPAAQGQPDYSQQWIEYYRSMGMTREAEAIEAQVKAKQQQGGQVSGKYCATPSRIISIDGSCSIFHVHSFPCLFRSCTAADKWSRSSTSRTTCSRRRNSRLQCRMGKLLSFIGKD